MFLIVGLGNPGAEYAKTRHNVGFMVADAIHDKYGFAPYKVKFDGLISEGKIDGEKVYLLKPQTYMNLSGNSVVKAAAFYKILPQPKQVLALFLLCSPQSGQNHVPSLFGTTLAVRPLLPAPAPNALAWSSTTRPAIGAAETPFAPAPAISFKSRLSKSVFKSLFFGSFSPQPWQ